MTSATVADGADALCMGDYDAGSRSFSTIDTAINSPADLAGLKIRVQKSQTSVDMVAAMGGAGANPAWIIGKWG